MELADNQQNQRINLQRRRLQPTKDEISTKRELLLQPAKCGCLQTRCKQNKGSEQQMLEKHKKLRIRQTKWMCWPTKTRLWICQILPDINLSKGRNYILRCWVGGLGWCGLESGGFTISFMRGSRDKPTVDIDTMPAKTAETTLMENLLHASIPCAICTGWKKW